MSRVAPVLAAVMVAALISGAPDFVAHGAAPPVPGAARLVVTWRFAEDEARVRAALAGAGSDVSRRLYGGGFVVEVPAGTDSRALADRLGRLPGVAAAEPDRPVSAVWSDGTPNDTFFLDGTQWGPRRVQAEHAWRIARGDGVTIAIIDTGVDLDHEDLSGRLWANPGEIPGNGIDDDGNGFIDDVHGWDFVNRDGDPRDDNGHGTHCAGIAAAETDNAVGIAGMAPGARIMAVKVLDSRGSGSTATLAEGISYALDNGADIISVSIGGPSGASVLLGAIRRATAARVPVIAAAGNEGGAILFPAAYPESLCVGASDADDVRTSYSNYGSALDVLAPGGTPGRAIYSTVRNNGYDWKIGTSMATPHVSGVAALLRGERPALSVEAVEHLLSETALRPGGHGWDQYYGHGVVQAGSALDLMLADTTPPVSEVTTAVAPPEGVLVTMVADDVGLGVDRIDWWLDDGTRGTGPLAEVTYPGLRTFSWAATDLAGNREEARTVSLEVTDTLPPVTTSDAKGVYYGGSAVITLTAVDRGIGVAQTSWSLNDGPWVGGTRVSIGTTGDHMLAFRSADLLGHVEDVRVVALRVYGSAEVNRVSGADRYATSVAASKSTFADGSASTAVLASGRDFPDALAASGLAGALKGPVLLTRPDRLPAEVLSELRRLGARKAVLVGGDAAIGPQVVTALAEEGIAVERVFGADRYETAAAVARRIAAEAGTPPALTFVARGDDFADALAVAPVAYRRMAPVLLTRPSSLPAATRAVLAADPTTEIVVAGGTGAIGDPVFDSVDALNDDTPVRVAGASRYETAALVAGYARDRGWATGAWVGVATGASYPDALSGASAIGPRAGVIVLTRPLELTDETRVFVETRCRAGDPIRVFGGASAVSPGVLGAIKGIPLL